MQSGEPELHSFVIKMWLNTESRKDGTEYRSWRGHITHVPGGERRHIHRLEDILAFISPYLSEASPPSRPTWWRNLWRKLR